jgi:hypothetical protein
MKFTFAHDLKFIEASAAGQEHIDLNHHFRFDLKIHIISTDKMPTGWQLDLKGNKAIIKNAKTEIFEYVKEHLESRIPKPMDKITYADIKDAASAVQYKSIG